jgi:single-stranded-DNA-specific exonuclease
MVADSFEHAKLSVAAGGDMGKVVIMHHSTYSEGVVGLIASRLVEEYYRPSVAISVREKISKGSARSINGVNIVELLRSVSGTLSEVGGHPMAAGFSLETERIEEFYLALNKEAEKIPDSLFERELKVDMEIPLALVSESLYKKLQELSPFGMGNPEPVFVARGLNVKNIRKLGNDGSHLKLTLSDGKKYIDAIGFGMGESGVEQGDKIDIMFTLDENTWNGDTRLQLKLRDLNQRK